MQEIIVEVLVGMFLLLYFMFVVFTMYLTATTDKGSRLDMVGKLLWYHGLSWMFLMVFTCAGSAVIIVSRFMYRTLGL